MIIPAIIPGRKFVHAKTDRRCHFCGIKVPFDKFQADHAVSHVRGGKFAVTGLIAGVSQSKIYFRNTPE